MKHWSHYLANKASDADVDALSKHLEWSLGHIRAQKEKLAWLESEFEKDERRLVAAMDNAGYSERDERNARDEAMAIQTLRTLIASKTGEALVLDTNGGHFALRQGWVRIARGLGSGYCVIHESGRARIEQEDAP